jgi:hypothetical protein
MFESNEEYGISAEDSSLNQFLSTPAEIRHAVERNAIDRGVLFVGIIVELGIDELLGKIEALATTLDKEDVYESADILGIHAEALALLDSLDPPIPFPYYFCTPNSIVSEPRLVFYYRNISMLSQKVMKGIGLDTTAYENGAAPTRSEALELVQYLNDVVSQLLLDTGVTRHRHIEMLMANLGDSLGGSSRNEVGRMAMAEVMRLLITELGQYDRLESIVYSTRASLIPGTSREEDVILEITPSLQMKNLLDQLEASFVKYKELRLRNGVLVLVDKNARWRDGQIDSFNVDVQSIGQNVRQESGMLWAAEVKGGADPAGSDEHWKTARSALERILERAQQHGVEKPPLSFVGRTIVKKVAVEIKAWLDRGDLVSAYNLTKILTQPEEKKRFLDDMMRFLGYEE